MPNEKIRCSAAVVSQGCPCACSVSYTVPVFGMRRSISLSDLLVDVPAGDANTHGTVEWAKEMAKRNAPPVFPALTYTETNYQWILLYEHVQRGQIDPRVLRRMKTGDLEYLAGHPSPHPDLIEAVGTPEQRADARGRAIKIVENITRATRELQRRSARRAYLWSTAIAAGVGGAVGGLVVALLGGD